jgi:hypothetical protein
MTTRRKRRRTPKPDSDSQALRGAVLAIITGMGNGGLTWFAKQLGITRSNLRKRLTTAVQGFDGPTMRACLLINQLRAQPEHDEIEGTKAGAYEIIEIGSNGSRMPLWRPLTPRAPHAPTADTPAPEPQPASPEQSPQ